MFASSGNEIKLWDFDSNELLSQIGVTNRAGLSSPIHSFNIRSDNLQIATVVDKDSVRLINLDSDGQYDLSDVSDPKCCTYDSTGRHLAVGTLNSFIEMYDFKSQSMKKKTWKIQPSSGSVNCILWNKNDRYIATGCSTGSIILFNTVVNTFSRPLINPKVSSNYSVGVTALQYSARNQSQLASGYDDGSVILWDTNKDSPVSLIKAHSLPCTSVVISPINSMLMASSGLDSIINFYDYVSKKTVKILQCKDGITSFDLNSNGYNYFIGTVNGYIYTYDLRYNQDTPLKSFKAHDTAVHCVKYLQNLNTSTNNSIISKTSSLSTNNSLVNGQSIEITQTQVSSGHIKKSNSLHGFDSQQSFSNNSTNSLQTNQQAIMASLGVPPSINIYSPENQKSSFKIKTQLSSGNIANLLNSNTQSDSFNLTKQTPLSSTVNTSNVSNVVVSSHLVNINLNSATSPLNNGSNKNSNFSKISNQRGQADIFSPLNNSNASPLRHEQMQIDENNINSCLNFNQVSPSPVNIPKHSSTQIIIQNTTPIQSEPIYSQSNDQKEVTQIVVNEPKSELFLNEQKSSLLPLEMIREIIKDTVDDFKDELMSENFKFKAEMLKEFMNLKRDINEAVKACSINDALVEEIKRLKEENKRLKKMF